MSLIDDQLDADLSAIDKEVERRKKARPFELYATWAMSERMLAIAKHSERENRRRIDCAPNEK